MDVKQLEINGEDYKIKDEGARDTTAANLSPCTGRDLTELFADEIAEYSDPWAWIKARINAANWQGLANGDYIPLEFNSETHEMQINIDTYYTQNIDYKVGHHIDFISRDCPTNRVYWQEDGSNNGVSGSPYPYVRSTLKATLDDEWYPLLPDAAKSVITSRTACVEYRYSSSGSLTESNGFDWLDIGYLWTPDEVEVYGQTVLATPYYSGPGSVQYPVFANGWSARCKGRGPGGSSYRWWLRSVYAGGSTSAVMAYSDGTPDWIGVNASRCVPLCFRIEAD